MKTIQQILEEERSKSKINDISDADINRALANKAKAQDPEIKKKLSESIKKSYSDNPEQIKIKSEKLKKANDVKFSNPEYRKKLKEQRQKQAKDPLYLEKLHQGMQKRKSNPGYEQSIKNAIEKRNLNAEWKKNTKLAQNNRSEEHKKNLFRAKAYAIKTPDGYFEGLDHAHKYYNEKRNFKNGRKWILGMMKKFPADYHKVSWLEFDNFAK